MAIITAKIDLIQCTDTGILNPGTGNCLDIGSNIIDFLDNLPNINLINLFNRSFNLNYFNVIDNVGGGACQFLAIANNLIHLAKFKLISLPKKYNTEKKLAELLYITVKNIVQNILIKFTVQQLKDIWGFTQLDNKLSTELNLTNWISDVHGPSNGGNINNYKEYIQKLKYGTWTSNFETKILFNNNPIMTGWWKTNFNINTPCLAIYFNSNKNNLVPIEINNSLDVNQNTNKDILINLLYVPGHYKTLYLKNDNQKILLQKFLYFKSQNNFGKSKVFLH